MRDLLALSGAWESGFASANCVWSITIDALAIPDMGRALAKDEFVPK
ncbi:hypothetical protein [Aurantiacibacter marinus]|nr:hypothetical protein [Aurantiacibacter marinus]